MAVNLRWLASLSYLGIASQPARQTGARVGKQEASRAGSQTNRLSGNQASQSFNWLAIPLAMLRARDYVQQPATARPKLALCFSGVVHFSCRCSMCVLIQARQFILMIALVAAVADRCRLESNRPTASANQNQNQNQAGTPGRLVC